MNAKHFFLLSTMCLLGAGCSYKAKQADAVPLSSVDTIPVLEKGEVAADSLADVQACDTLLSQKQLDALMEEIGRRWDSVAPCVRANVMTYSTGLHTLDVHLVLNTPER